MISKIRLLGGLNTTVSMAYMQLLSCFWLDQKLLFLLSYVATLEIFPSLSSFMFKF